MRFLDNSCSYHVVSRAAFRRFLFDDVAKDKFVNLMRRQAEFCGAEIAAFCVMSNHFHILLSFVNNPIPANDSELLRRYHCLYPQTEWLSEKTLSPERLEQILKEDGPDAEQMRKQLHARMGDLSVFMKELKQRFSIWFNRHRDNVGTLWESNFKSQIVENERKALETVAAYIEMNPVRAGIVERPEMYGWSSMGFSKARSIVKRISCFKFWFFDLSLEEVVFSNSSQSKARDGRMLRAGCLGSSAFITRMCEKFIPKRAGHFKPVPLEHQSGPEEFYTLRRVC